MWYLGFISVIILSENAEAWVWCPELSEVGGGVEEKERRDRLHQIWRCFIPVDAGVCLCWWRPETDIGIFPRCLPSYFLRQASPYNRSSPILLDLLINEFQGFPPAVSPQRWDDKCLLLGSAIFMWVLGEQTEGFSYSSLTVIRYHDNL